MFKKIIVILLLFSSFCPYLGAKEELKVENRGNGWTLNTFDPTSLEPTTLKYFHYFLLRSLLTSLAPVLVQTMTVFFQHLPIELDCQQPYFQHSGKSCFQLGIHEQVLPMISQKLLTLNLTTTLNLEPNEVLAKPLVK